MGSKKTTPQAGNNRLQNSVFATLLLLVVIISSYWVARDLASGEIRIIHVFVAALITAADTGFGAVPFLFIKDIGNR